MSTGTASVDTTVDAHGITAAIPDIIEYISRQRWSGAHDMRITSLSFEDAAVLAEGDATLLFTICRVTFVDSRSRDYALPLGLRRTGDPLAERAPTFMIGSLPDGETGRFLYDALGDPDYIHWLWQTVKHQLSVPTALGTLRGECPDADALEPGDTPWVRVLTTEQSNTSMEIGEHSFLKHLRRLQAGPAHELEMASALTRSGFTHIAPILGSLLYQPRDAAEAPVAIVQPYLRNSADGWLLALTSLRDLYADAEEALGGEGTQPGDVVAQQGGAFVAEAARLGQVVAEMHLALARVQAPGMTPEPITAARLEAWSDSMIRDLDALFEQPAAAALDGLRARREALRARFDALRTLQPEGLCTRIHGDLHLGQMLRVDSGWVVLDFEGEPNRAARERRELSSPLRDVAGILRSFDYAAAAALTERLMPESADWEGMMSFGDEWARRNRESFWQAYVQALRDTDLLPRAEDALTLRRAFELQKAVYEVGYELGHRPTWTAIPLRFLMGGADDTGN